MDCRFGIIGAGRIVSKFCEAVALNSNAKVVAVSSKSLERAKQSAKENNIEHYYDSYEEMLKRDDIDVVYICTTNNYHFENIKLAIKYKKHVLCEKCMVATKNEAETLFDLARENNIFLMEAMWSRFLPSTQKVRDWVKQGRIGNLQMASASVGFCADKSPDNRYYGPQLGGGTFYDIGVYAIEIICFMIGEEVRQVNSTVTFADTGVDESANISLRFDKCIANLQCSFAANLKGDAFIYGDKGCIRIPSFVGGGTIYLLDNDGKEIDAFTQPEVNGFTYEIEEVVRCLTQGKLTSDIMPAKDTIRCAEIFEICLEQNKQYRM